jgi:hypothetical protein
MICICSVCALSSPSHTYCSLYPFPTGDDHKFRSPAEFTPHAAWLIAGMPPGRCKCKYCSQGTFSQKRLNEELDAGFKEAMNNEGKNHYQALKNKQQYTPRDLPLEEVFLKPAPIPE